MNAVDNAGWTPLFEAIREHKEGTTLDVIRALVAAGADVNAKSPPDDGGGTVLHNLASKAHYMAIAKVLRRNTYSTHTNNNLIRTYHESSIYRKIRIFVHEIFRYFEQCTKTQNT